MIRAATKAWASSDLPIGDARTEGSFAREAAFVGSRQPDVGATIGSDGKGFERIPDHWITEHSASITTGPWISRTGDPSVGCRADKGPKVGFPMLRREVVHRALPYGMLSASGKGIDVTKR